MTLVAMFETRKLPVAGLKMDWKATNSKEEGREQGFTISHSELENHTSAVAAPIYNHLGEVVAGMAIVGFEANYQGENVDIFEDKLIKATTEISRQLGYEQP